MKVSSIVGLISENINYTDRSIANTELMRSYINLLNRYSGENFTLDDIDNIAKTYSRVDNPIMNSDDANMTNRDKMIKIIGKNMSRADGPTLRREWSSSNVGRNIAKAVQDSKTVYERRYDEFAPRSWSFSNSTNASKEDRRMHAKLESLLLARAGFLNKDKDSRLNNYILYARPTDNPNTFDLVAMAGGKNIILINHPRSLLRRILDSSESAKRISLRPFLVRSIGCSRKRHRNDLGFIIFRSHISFPFIQTIPHTI